MWCIKCNKLKDIFAFVSKMDLRTRQCLRFVGPLSLRIYLAPVVIAAGLSKLSAFDNTVAWFGNAEWGLGLPFPMLMAVLAIAAEIGGGFALLLGFMTRLATIPLMVTMLVATFAVHWDNGWFAIAPSNPSMSMAAPLAKVGFPGSAESLENSAEVGERLSAARSILKEHGNYRWLTGKGNLVVLNNGIEFAVTYFIMLLVLFFYGGGRYASLDYWFRHWFGKGEIPPCGAIDVAKD